AGALAHDATRRLLSIYRSDTSGQPIRAGRSSGVNDAGRAESTPDASVVNGHRASGGRRADGRRGGRGEMRARSDVLGTAILGLLHESPMHGYELRKRLNEVLGSFQIGRAHV